VDLGVGRNAAERRPAYRALFRGALDAQFVADIRAAPLPRGRRPTAPEPAGRRQLNPL